MASVSPSPEPVNDTIVFSLSTWEASTLVPDTNSSVRFAAPVSTNSKVACTGAV
jgi:hypothetical protein